MNLFKNPELKRNLWLEFNKRRLIAMPLGLLAVFIVAYLKNDNKIDSNIAWVSLLMYGVLTFLWGTRQAAEVITREVNLGTWSQQKMSNITPWKMVWGKLLGSTAFIWYGNIFCFLFFSYSMSEKSSTKNILYYIGLMITFGILSHTITMLASLYSMRYRHSFERFEIMFYQFLGIIAALPLLWNKLWNDNFGLKFGENLLQNGNIYWYNQPYPVVSFVLITAVITILWVLIGLYFLMRTEFLINNSPVIWLLFALFVVCLISGLDKAPSNYLSYYRFPVAPGYALAFNIMLGIMYVLACGESRDALKLHLLKYYIFSKQWKRFLAIMPRTVVTFPVVILTLINVILNIRLPFEGEQGYNLMNVIPYCALAAVFFMIRDIGIIYLFSIKNKGKNSDTLTPILIILTSYTLLPIFFINKDFDLIAGCFLPWPQENIILTSILPLIQALVVTMIIINEWFIKKQDWKINDA